MRLRYFFERRDPRPQRLLLIESGSRALIENHLPALRRTWGNVPVDLVTCYSGLPAGLDPTTSRVYRVNDYRGREGRARLYRELREAGHNVMGMLCSAEPVMTKWKWALALRVPAKVFIINENGDYFWLDYTHWSTMVRFVLFRAGLSGEDAPRTLARLLFFPFTFLYLLLYATNVHFKRALRRGFR